MNEFCRQFIRRLYAKRVPNCDLCMHRLNCQIQPCDAACKYEHDSDNRVEVSEWGRRTFNDRWDDIVAVPNIDVIAKQDSAYARLIKDCHYENPGDCNAPCPDFPCALSWRYIEETRGADAMRKMQDDRIGQ